MTEKTLEIMKELTQIVGISGDEKEVSKALAAHYKGLCDEVIYDNLGSIFAVKKCGKENAKRVMVCAHMDEVGFMITEIHDNGLLSFIKIGDIADGAMYGSRVTLKAREGKELTGAIVADADTLEKGEGKKMKIDLGCLAKGYSADKVAQFLREEGVTSALINLGGNILTIGKNQQRGNQPWQIGIQDPANPRGNHLMTIPVVNKSVVTSGIYERHLTVDGKDYHHIFDSQTGYPVETELASLTIISDKSVDGEIWTTRLFGERPASILWQVESLEGIEAILIDKEGHLSCSSGMPTL